MIALSVMWIPSGHTSVQHLVMLQRPTLAVARTNSVRSRVSSGCISSDATLMNTRGPAKARLFSSWSRITWQTSWHRKHSMHLELLDAIDVLLHHPVRPVGLRRLEPERRDRLGLLEIERDVGDEVADQGERADRRHRDGLALGEEFHAGHAHEPRPPVDLGAARAAFARLAVPADGEVRRLGRLDAVDHVQHHHPFLGLHAIVPELAARRVAAENAHREGRHHFRSWKSALSSPGISGRGSRESWSVPFFRRSTTLTLPH